MKPRIEKKVSKKIADIIGNAFGQVWIDDEYEPDYHFDLPKGSLLPKQKRENMQNKVRVNNMPSIGGEADYWGEGTSINTVYNVACNVFICDQIDVDEKGEMVFIGNPPAINARWCLKKARELAS